MVICMPTTVRYLIWYSRNESSIAYLSKVLVKRARAIAKGNCGEDLMIGIWYVSQAYLICELRALISNLYCEWMLHWTVVMLDNNKFFEFVMSISIFYGTLLARMGMYQKF